jgi:hypothetical protein
VGCELTANSLAMNFSAKRIGPAEILPHGYKLLRQSSWSSSPLKPLMLQIV